MREGSCPVAIAQRMHFHPDSVPPFVQLQRARSARNPKMPMMAADAPGQLTLALNHESATPAFLQGLRGAEPEIKFEHSRAAS